MTDHDQHAGGAPLQQHPEKPTKVLSPAAARALAEAAARRAERERLGQDRPNEVGRAGLDPARYGDWEVKGVASDF